MGDSNDASEVGTGSVGSSRLAAAGTKSLRSATAESCPVARTSNCPGRRRWDRRNVCFFCELPQAKLTRHLQRSHGKEAEVQLALLHPKHSAERRKAFSDLTKRGNYRHNIAVRSGEKRGEIIACNRARTTKTGRDFVACVTCKGFFLRKTLWRHMRICNPSEGGRVQARARAEMPPTGASSAKLQKILASMCIDGVSLLCKTDEVILSLGECLCSKHGNEAKDWQNIRNRMWELGRLLEFLRRDEPEVNLRCFLRAGKFSQLTAGVRELSGFNSETNRYGTPSLALKVGQSLKMCADQLLAHQLEKGVDTSETREFLELYTLQWTKRVSRHAVVTLQEGKWNRAEEMPVAADIQSVHRYLHEETAKRTAELGDVATPQAYKNLAELVLARLIMFNRRRQGEASFMTVDAYQKAISNTNDNPEVTSALSEFEKHLASNLTRVVVRGKKGRGVPILLTHDMRASIELMLKCRGAAGVSASRYVFVNSLSADGRPLRGSDCLRKVAVSSGIDKPSLLTSTKLRKHIATLSQVLNLKDNELDLLATFLGHDIRVHREVYRMPEATTQLALVSKLLMASERGIGTWRGQSLAEIRLEDIPDEPEDLADDNQDETDDEVSDDVQSRPEPESPRSAVQSPQSAVQSSPQSAVRSPTQARALKQPVTTRARVSKQPRAPVKRKTWTADENRAIDSRFKSCIERHQLPGKADCVSAIACESALSERSWTDVKNCVYNRIKARKKWAQ